MPVNTPRLSRREFVWGGLATAFTIRSAFAAGTVDPTRVLLGTTGKVSKGIYTADWNATTGELGTITLAATLVSPSFLATRRVGSLTRIYAVSEDGKDDSGVNALETIPGSRELRLLNKVSSFGNGPTHLSLSSSAFSILPPLTLSLLSFTSSSLPLFF